MPSLIQRIDVAVGQFDKEILINDNESILEGYNHPVLQVNLNTPPALANNLDSYIVGSAPSGAWSAIPKYWVMWLNGGWVAASPTTRLRVYDLATSAYYRYNGTDWVVEVTVSGVPFTIDQSTTNAPIIITNSDHGKSYPCNGTITQSLPSGLADGFQIYFDNQGTGTLTITGTLKIFTTSGGFQSASSCQVKGLCHCRQVGGNIWRLVAEEFSNIVV